jgi:hypothetical protein
MPDIIPPMNLDPAATPWGRAIQNLVVELQRTVARLSQGDANAVAGQTSSTKVLTQNVVSLQGLAANLQAQINALLASSSISTGSVTASGAISGGTISSGAGITAAGAVGAGGDVSAGGNVVAPNGTLVSTYARTHQVVTGYVSAWLDSAGNLLASASSKRFKRDITPYRRDAWRQIRPVLYRLRSAWILADLRGNTSDVPYEIGVLAEDMVKDFPELVAYDDKGKPWSFHYERLGVVAIDGLQQLDGEVQDLRAQVAELRALINRK